MAKKPQVSFRKPPPAPPLAAVEGFVMGGPAAVVPPKRKKRSAGPTAGLGRTTLRTRKRGDQVGQLTQRVTLWIPPDLYRRARIAAIEQGADVSLFVTRALEAALRRA